jgi:2-oxoglutarate dehydrogenase E1 component
MVRKLTGTTTPWQGFNGPNLGYVHQLYEQYLQDPSSIDDEMKALFDQWGAPPLFEDREVMSSVVGQNGDSTEMMEVAVNALKLAHHIRINGHLAAHINTFEEDEKLESHLFDPAAFGLTEADLSSIPAKIVWPEAPARYRTGLDVIRHFKEVYTSSTAYQFMHVHDMKERNWLNQVVETGAMKRRLAQEDYAVILKKLTEAEEFELFLHRTFTGQKRFSVEGLETLIPMLDELVREGANDGVRHVLLGMAHRGRLNVLAHILGKPYEKIFSEFHHAPNKELVPSEGSMGINYGWTGDVKYHLGAQREMKDQSTRLRLTLAHNPSHLEFVGAVVEGYTRAAQEDRQVAGAPQQDISKAFSILIHGDAAFPGEGIVAETLNFSRLRGYQTGGTIHIIANNQIGFTTDSEDSRSTRYSSDLAKGFEIPIVHVNSDDPEACLQAIYLAYEYRKLFHKDFLIDLIGYRRHGHNEMDDPTVTNPLFYAKVAKHPGVRSVYAEKLLQQGLISKQKEAEIKEEVQNKLKAAYEKMKAEGKEQDTPPLVDPNEDLLGNTAVPLAVLSDMNNELLQWPTEFSIYPKLAKILKRREEAFKENGSIDWALAESLAFASILADGKPIRMTGQDTERGTFAHRNLVLHDYKTGKAFIPLQHLSKSRASFGIYNSPLSEASVLGFEYGYDVLAKDTLVLWEAQFGDFANAAQVILDTFISAGRAKWGQISNLVMLLPHGYEGQGPEHSSARLERFLQLSAEKNWTVANLTSAAQYFHLLRWQASRVGKEEARPLVIMSPKSLLRNPRATSSWRELTEGTFKQVYEKSNQAGPEYAERLVLCSGKVATDLEAEWDSMKVNDKRVYFARVEQLYPFPEKALHDLLSRLPQLKEIVWVQEEPHNMGAWFYIEPRLKTMTKVPVHYIGRPDRSSPAEGMPEAHKAEQQRIVREAILLTPQASLTF